MLWLLVIIPLCDDKCMNNVLEITDPTPDNATMTMLTNHSLNKEASNVYMVKILYILPNDSIERPNIDSIIRGISKNLRDFYAHHLGRTFQIFDNSLNKLSKSNNNLFDTVYLNYTANEILDGSKVSRHWFGENGPLRQRYNIIQHAIDIINGDVVYAHQRYIQHMNHIVITDINVWCANGSNGLSFT